MNHRGTTGFRTPSQQCSIDIRDIRSSPKCWTTVPLLYILVHPEYILETQLKFRGKGGGTRRDRGVRNLVPATRRRPDPPAQGATPADFATIPSSTPSVRWRPGYSGTLVHPLHNILVTACMENLYRIPAYNQFSLPAGASRLVQASRYLRTGVAR